MALNAGTRTHITTGDDQFSNSMAEAMETAFLKDWPVIMHTAAPKTNDQLRLIFIAVAQGVVRYLKDNADAFNIVLSATDATISIETTGTLYPQKL